MATYFRYQYGHYTLEEMQAHVSADGGGDGGTEGICATESVTELLNNTVWAADPKAEVLILRGIEIQPIYDGVRIYPTEIVARMSAVEFAAKVADGSAYEYEEW